MLSLSDIEIWAVVPAAGSGARMGSALPKQYLPLGEKTVLEHSLERLLSLPFLSGLVVALADGDALWPSLPVSRNKGVYTVRGGADRAASVLSALSWINTCQIEAKPRWALVHDAARPCVRIERVQALVQACMQAQRGGLLGRRCTDTLKRCDQNLSVLATEDRSSLWHAHTPQFFPVEDLYRALIHAQEKNHVVTDEASAMESMSQAVLMLEDRSDNIKITHPQDLDWARVILQKQAEENSCA